MEDGIYEEDVPMDYVIDAWIEEQERKSNEKAGEVI